VKLFRRFFIKPTRSGASPKNAGAMPKRRRLDPSASSAVTSVAADASKELHDENADDESATDEALTEDEDDGESGGEKQEQELRVAVDAALLVRVEGNFDLIFTKTKPGYGRMCTLASMQRVMAGLVNADEVDVTVEQCTRVCEMLEDKNLVMLRDGIVYEV
jgi:hypothetical protein